MSKNVILCVDDDSAILDSLRFQIRRKFGRNYNCEIAQSADEAMEVIEEFLSDGISIIILVSDWLMPGIKGDEFLIRVHEKYPKIIKIMLSGQVDEHSIENAVKNANLYKYISKPWTEDDLYKVLSSALEEAKDAKTGYPMC